VSSFPKVARRAFASIAVVACAIVSLPSGAAVTLLGNIALQPKLPARLTTCNVSVDGGGFVPNIAFASQPDPVARYTVTLAFFDRTNIAVGRVDVTDHGADVYDLPAHADSMSCAITRLTLDDGTVYPAAGGSGASLGGVAIGVLGAGAIIGIALGASHHSSTNNPAPTMTPSPTPTPSATSSGPTATPTATGATATPTPTSAATSSTSYPPTPSPFPTSSTTAVPTLRPQHTLR
jgi:hypothetical protein